MRVGIIGAGIISESHLRALAQTEEIEAVCIADINISSAERFAIKYGLKAYSDYKEMVLRESPEAVIIALPHYLHEEAGVFCMENSCHVLMEKPMAISTVACDRLIEAAERNKRTLFVGHVCYYFQQERNTAQILSGDIMGKISMINIKRYCNYFYAGRPAWFLNPLMSGGGILANIGTHEIERLIRFGGNIRDTKALAVKRENCEVEGIVNAVFQLDNGITASVKLNGYSEYQMNELEIICEKGILRIIAGESHLEILSGNKKEIIETVVGSDPFELQLKDFLKCVETGEKPYLSGEYGRKVIDAVEHIYMSAGIRYLNCTI